MILGTNWARGNRPANRYIVQDLNKLNRQLNNMVTIAQVTAVNSEDMTITASAFGGELTGLKAFVLGQGSGDYKQWTPPVVGDTVLLINDNGNFNNSYALPIRLPNSFNSDITGSIVQAGDLTLRYNKEDNSYKIKLNDNEILVAEEGIVIKADSDTKIQLTPGDCKVEIGGSEINLSNTSCQISVPGGTLSISAGSLTFNGQQVHRS